MFNIEKERFKEILNNPHKFIAYLDEDNWVVFKKKEDIKDLTDEQIHNLETYFLMESCEFIIKILNELKFKTINI